MCRTMMLVDYVIEASLAGLEPAYVPWYLRRCTYTYLSFTEQLGSAPFFLALSWAVGI